MSGDAGYAGELVLVAEDTEFARAPTEPQKIAGMRPDAVFLQQIPDLLLLPVPYGTEPVYMTEASLSVAQVGLVGFQDGIARSLFAFFSAFIGKDESPDVLESRVVTQGGGADVDFQVGRAPADTEVRRRLREATPCRGFALLASNGFGGSVREFEMDGSREAVFPEHLPGESAFFPLVEDGDAEGLSEFPAVARGDFPVEEARATSVDLLVPELDFFFRNPVIEEKEQAGRGVLASGEADDIIVLQFRSSFLPGF